MPRLQDLELDRKDVIESKWWTGRSGSYDDSTEAECPDCSSPVCRVSPALSLDRGIWTGVQVFVTLWTRAVFTITTGLLGWATVSVPRP